MSELIQHLSLGFSVALTLQNLMYCFIGCFLGTLVGVLPGIGPAMSERIVAKLRRRMAKFALMIAKEFPESKVAEKGVLGEALEALIGLGFSSIEAREKIDAVTAGKTKYKTVEDVILAIYQQEKN